MNDDIELRKYQEALKNIINLGAHKEIAKWHKALFDAYREVGFDVEQALKLVIRNWYGNIIK